MNDSLLDDCPKESCVSATGADPDLDPAAGASAGAGGGVNDSITLACR